MDHNRVIETLEKRLDEVGTIAFRCNKTFSGVYKAERESKLSNYVKIHEKGETFLLRNDKEDKYYRINDAESLFFEGMVLINSIIRAINEGVLEEIEGYKKPEITVYSIDELPVMCSWNDFS